MRSLRDILSICKLPLALMLPADMTITCFPSCFQMCPWFPPAQLSPLPSRLWWWVLTSFFFPPFFSVLFEGTLSSSTSLPSLLLRSFTVAGIDCFPLVLLLLLPPLVVAVVVVLSRERREGLLCAEPLDQLVQSNLRKATCTEQLAQSNSTEQVAQRNLHRATCTSSVTFIYRTQRRELVERTADKACSASAIPLRGSRMARQMV